MFASMVTQAPWNAPGHIAQAPDKNLSPPELHAAPHATSVVPPSARPEKTDIPTAARESAGFRFSINSRRALRTAATRPIARLAGVPDEAPAKLCGFWHPDAGSIAGSDWASPWAPTTRIS